MHQTIELSHYSGKILQEIINDESADWFVPVLIDVTRPIFERCQMKFINGNLNYDFHNMLVHAQHNTRYHPGFTAALEMCNEIGKLTNNAGPFGRMCIWKVPPGMFIEPHKDNYTYHQHVTRWLYFVNLDTSVTRGFINGDTIRTDAGFAVNFDPSTEIHAFKNNSDTDWYFIGFDIWDVDKLAKYPRVDPEPIFYLSSH